MKGFVEKRMFSGGRSNYGFIRGEDGENYFFKGNDAENCKSQKLLTYNLVDFEPVSYEGDERKRAMKIKKIGHGKKHPYITYLADMKDFIKSISMNKQQKERFLVNIDRMVKYFSTIEDYEQFKSLREMEENDDTV